MWSDLQLLLGFNAALILVGGLIKRAVLDSDGPSLNFFQDVYQVGPARRVQGKYYKVYPSGFGTWSQFMWGSHCTQAGLLVCSV